MCIVLFGLPGGWRSGAATEEYTGGREKRTLIDSTTEGYVNENESSRHPAGPLHARRVH